MLRMYRLFASILVLVVCSALSASAAVIRVNGSTGSDSYDGSSWALAKKTVKAGLNAAVSGDEVWVAGDDAHPYVECITLKKGVGLYGGFAGTETSRDQRNWKANVTVLDGNQAGSVVTGYASATTTTRLDGFTVRNGRNSVSGAGIWLYQGSPTICNNIITGNLGPAIYCWSCSPVIANNTIKCNTADGSGGGGILCSSASPTITNNTITANSARRGGGAIWGYNCYATISNNIIAFNSSGICISSGTPTLRNNDVYGNSAYNYLGLSSGAGDISADPILVSREYGDVHIRPGSPCVNGGWNGAAGLPTTDIDGQPRVQDGTVDIGSDESDGNEPPGILPTVIRVSPDGDDLQDGSSWGAAMKTIQAGIDGAAALGGEVWVRYGSYSECISLRIYVYLYGGFAGNETARAERNWSLNLSTVDGGGAGPVVTVPPVLGYECSCIDGFAVRNGKVASGDGGGGIDCRYSAPIIRNNTITGNHGVGLYFERTCATLINNVIAANMYAGIFCDYSSPTITENVIEANMDGGIDCSVSSPTITGNMIVANVKLGTNDDGGGIKCVSSSPVIVNNMIVANANPGGNGGGIGCFYNSSPVIANNLIEANTARTGGGIYCGVSSCPAISNNVLTKNTSSSGGGLYCSSSSPAVSNNVVASNSSGLYNRDGTPVLKNNCVYNPGGYNYSGISAGATDIQVDPMFLAPWVGEYHVGSASPCINAGDNTAVQTGWTDLDGKPRILPTGGTVDIGCFEWDSSPYWVRRIGQARAVPEQFAIELRGKPITAAFDGGFYIEDSDRAGGMRVLSAQAVAPGDMATVVGQPVLDGGERVLQATSVSITAGSAQDIPGALLMGNRSLGGGGFFWNYGGENCGQQGILGAFGLNNIGLLVRTAGRVVEIEPVTATLPTWFVIDDGSGVSVKCVAQDGVNIGVSWGCVGVTGISSCEMVGSELHRLLRVRSQQDITPYP